MVFTDERDQRYLDELYDALKSTGRDLCGNQASVPSQVEDAR